MSDNVKVIVIGTRKIAAPKYKRIVIKPRVFIERAEVPYWQEMGWEKESNCYYGFYKNKYGAWEGVAEEIYAGKWMFYIYNPPVEELKTHTHWGCFRNNGDGSWWLHFSLPPRDISAGIMKMEQIISESFKNWSN